MLTLLIIIVYDMGVLITMIFNGTCLKEEH